MSPHTIVERFARSTPTAPAVACGGQTVSYAELDASADRLARHLRGQGVADEVPVGLFLGRTVDLAVSILAVLKAGGVCVPLDPGYPADRLSLVTQDAAVRIVLTERRLTDDLPPL